jgi:hypothetical protein
MTCFSYGLPSSICAKIQTETYRKRLTDLVAHDEACVVGLVDGPSAAEAGAMANWALASFKSGQF